MNNLRFDQVLDYGREIWRDRQLTVANLPAILGVVHGDICRVARGQAEGKPLDHEALQQELGNLVATTIRAIGDLGYDVDACVAVALNAQQSYVAKLDPDSGVEQSGSSSGP